MQTPEEERAAVRKAAAARWSTDDPTLQVQRALAEVAQLESMLEESSGLLLDATERLLKSATELATTHALNERLDKANHDWQALCARFEREPWCDCAGKPGMQGAGPAVNAETGCCVHCKRPVRDTITVRNDTPRGAVFGVRSVFECSRCKAAPCSCPEVM